MDDIGVMFLVDDIGVVFLEGKVEKDEIEKEVLIGYLCEEI